MQRATDTGRRGHVARGPRRERLVKQGPPRVGSLRCRASGVGLPLALALAALLMTPGLALGQDGGQDGDAAPAAADPGTNAAAATAAGALGQASEGDADPVSGPYLGSPTGSPFGRLGPYDLKRPRSTTWVPQIRLGAGVRHLDSEGDQSESQGFARLGLFMNFWKVQLGLEADLIFNDRFEPLEETYDDIDDVLGVVRYLELGTPGDTVHARAGVLTDASIGHGTIVGHYYNNTVLYQPRTGVAAEVDLRILGLQVMTNDVVEYDVNAARLTYLPLLDTNVPVLRGLGIGTTLAMDRRAPQRLIFNGDGTNQVTRREAVRAERDELYIYGVDLELPVLQNDWVTLVPYVDQNFFSGGGSGFHSGILGRVKLPVHIPLYASARFEYRRLGSRYLPTYFDAFYELERYRYPRVDSGFTKAQILRGVDQQHGFLYEAAVELPGLFQVGAIYEDNESSTTSRADIYAAFTGFDWLRLRAHYQKRGLNGIEDIDDIDQQTFISAQALVQIVSFIYADLRWMRYWEVEEENGRYRPVDVFEPSLAMIFEW